jgi:ArsR family transcriptional regulator
MAVYVSQLAPDFDNCQYRCMSKSSVALDVVAAVACCSPLVCEPLAAEAAERVAPLLRVLGDPVRLRLLSLVASHAGGEACVCELTGEFGVSQPTISHHLKVLHEAGLLAREKRGVWVYYRARTEALSALGALVGGGAGC